MINLIKSVRNRFLFLFFFLYVSLTFSQPQPYVILISFDGFRWDYCNRGITPNIELLVKDGVKASSLQPVFPTKTFPNHYSIVTGLYPENHGIIFNEFHDPYTNSDYKIWDITEVRNSRWYRGEAIWETLKFEGVKSASYFWPGSGVDEELKRPDYLYYYVRKDPPINKVNAAIKWLQLPYNQRPHLLTLYFSTTDHAGHYFGPDSEGNNLIIASIDSTLGFMLSELEKIGMRDSVNIVLLSDHGMTEVSMDKAINIEEILTGYNCAYSNYGPVMMIEPAKSEVDEVYEILKKNANHFTVYRKGNIPEYLHFKNNPFISELILMADLGWSVVVDENLKRLKPETFNGNHGYDNIELDMHGFFIASGPVFKNNFSTGTLNCLDVYPLLCKIFNVTPNANIDGRLERIEFILNNN
jgi:predicted AlkP superfamily pyrophosphatase or phosphodiesterase